MNVLIQWLLGKLNNKFLRTEDLATNDSKVNFHMDALITAWHTVIFFQAVGIKRYGVRMKHS
jgi:hypothetical protein